FFFLILLHPPTSTPFPYTTLFRSGITSNDTFGTVTRSRCLTKDVASVTTVFAKETTVASLGCCSASLSSTAAVTLCLSANAAARSEEHTSELQSPYDLVCRLLLEK